MKYYYNYTFAGIIVIACVFLFQQAVYGQTTMSFASSKDNTLIEDATGSLSNGAGDAFFAGRTGQGTDFRRRGVLAFDLSGVDADMASLLDSIRLTLTTSKAASAAEGTTISFHELTTDWGEGTSVSGMGGAMGAPSTTGDATWIHASYDTELWTNPGGDFDDTASGSFIYSTTIEVYELSSSEMVEDVRSWIEKPEENFGWLLMGDETVSRSAVKINSKEHADSSTHPTLELFFAAATSVEEDERVASSRIVGNYPNPFQQTTQIVFNSPVAASATLYVFDILGRQVQVERAVSVSPGVTNSIEVDGSSLAPGIYMYRLELTRPGNTEFLTGIMTRIE